MSFAKFCSIADTAGVVLAGLTGLAVLGMGIHLKRDTV
jgi:hypothetical protein